MTEAIFQTAFSRWAKHNMKCSCACELKLTKEKSLPFAALKEHQRNALAVARHGNLVHKLSDFSMGEKPFDCFVLSGVPAYLVVMFYTRGTKDFYCIDIDTLDRFIASSTKKSLTEDDARSLAEIIGHLA